MAKNELVKTLTFGLGNMYGFDKRKVELFALNDDGRKKPMTIFASAFEILLSCATTRPPFITLIVF